MNKQVSYAYQHLSRTETYIPASVNALLENISLHSTLGYDLSDKQIYDFVEKYGDEYDEKYGYFRESVISISMDGLDGAERMAAMMSGLRKNPPSEIGGKKVAIFKDFLEEKTVDFRSGAAYGTGLPKSDVLYYLMEDDNLVVVRPSGTEPKVKVYILANGKDDADAQANAEACIAGARKLIEG